MEFAIEFGGNVEDVTITLSGVATPSGFQAFIEARVLDTGFRTGMLILVDASQLDTSEMSAELLQAAMEPMLEREWRQPPRAVAILAVDARTFDDAVITRTFGRFQFAPQRVRVARRGAPLARAAAGPRSCSFLAVRIGGGDRAPCVPRDLEDDERDDVGGGRDG